MGLEAATYISQLVATNPVGATDPKSQGDDHLRLLKSVLQNTLPALTGAVLSTQAELNAIHGTQWLNANNGTGAAPAFSFSGDTNTGIYRAGADDMVLVAGGLLVLEAFNNAGVAQALFGDGVVSKPSISFNADVDTGIYRIAADNFGFATNGVYRGGISSTIFNTRILMQGPDGTTGGPSFSFENDSDTGMYRVGANTGGLSASATDRLLWDTTGVYIRNGQLKVADGSAGSPGFCFDNDTNTGITRLGSDDIAVIAGGTNVFEAITAASIFIGNSATTFNFGQASTTVWTIGTTTSATANAGGGAALPATVAGFLPWSINGTVRKIPYYAT